MRKAILLLVFSGSLLLAMIAPSTCQLTVGVSVGDWFVYEGTLVLWEAGPNVPFPPNEYALMVEEYTLTDWYNYTVTNIAGDVVTFEIVTHWSNGSETTSVLEDDMANSFTMQIIGANLEPGYQIRPEFDWEPILSFPYVWPARYLNDTILIDYQGGTRVTNVLNWTMPDMGFGDITRQVYYWDKITGIQVRYEARSNSTDFNSMEEYAYITVLQLADSGRNELVIPEFSTGTAFLLVSMVTSVSIIFFS